MTIEEIRAKKSEVETRIAELIYYFEEEIGTRVTHVDYERQDIYDEQGMPSQSRTKTRIHFDLF